jgi:hypothetical protein
MLEDCCGPFVEPRYCTRKTVVMLPVTRLIVHPTW